MVGLLWWQEPKELLTLYPKLKTKNNGLMFASIELYFSCCVQDPQGMVSLTVGWLSHINYCN